MGKAYIELQFKRRVLRLFTKDIAKVYRVNKRKNPKIPCFGEEDKFLPETDLDIDASETFEA